jgi:hypothetical protein
VDVFRICFGCRTSGKKQAFESNVYCGSGAFTVNGFAVFYPKKTRMASPNPAKEPGFPRSYSFQKNHQIFLSPGLAGVRWLCYN